MQLISEMLLIILSQSQSQDGKLLIDFGFIHLSFNEYQFEKKINGTERVVLK